MPTTDPIASGAALPTGARDVLQVEAGELRAVEDALRRTFGAYGYREVRTPVLEFAAQLERGQGAALERAYRLFDESGRVVVLRPDLTIPVARLVATRLAAHPGPLRVSYTGPAFRVPQAGRPMATEHRQAGAELVGLPGVEADAEIVTLLGRALRETGLRGFRIGLGDVSLTAAVLDGLGIDEGTRAAFGAAVAERDLVAWRELALSPPLDAERRELLAGLPGMRGGAEVPRRLAEAVPEAAGAARRMERLLGLLDLQDSEVLVDLGILRDWPYYSGLVLEAYAPGAGAPVAQGGRYDGLAARFGRPRAAVGFSIELELLHRALASQEAPANGARRGVVLVGGLDVERQMADALRADGIPVVALPSGDERAAAVAEAEGWRFVVTPGEHGYVVVDRRTEERFTSAHLEEDLPSRA